MTYHMSDYLKIVEPHIPHKLISAEALTEIRKIACMMPPVSRFGFESRLGDNTAKADFLLAIAPADGSCGIFAGQNALVTLPDILWSHPEWRYVRDFCIKWAEPTSIFHRSVHVLWLEFDIDANLADVPIPSLFLGFEPDVENGLEVTETALQTLFEDWAVKPLRKNLHLCFAALPAGARITDVGFMLSRQVEALRVVVYLQPEQLLPYLAHIGWPGEVSELEPIVKKLSSFVGPLALDIDLSDIVLPKIGLECLIYNNQSSQARSEALLDYLAENGQCIPDKRDALLGWIGTFDERSNPEQWPAFLRKASNQLGPQIVSAFVRALHHLKIVYRPDKPLEAKAYWGNEHFWVRRTNQPEIKVPSSMSQSFEIFAGSNC